MLIGLLVPHAYASPGDDPLEDRIEAREAGGQATLEGRTDDRLGDLSRRNAQDRSSLRGGQEGDSLLDDPEMMRFFDKMPPEIFAIYGTPEAAGAVSESVESTRLQRPRPAPEYLFPEITGAELNGMPVIDFLVTDEFGLGIEGFMQEENVEFEFTVNKLVPGSGGETNNWSTYVRADDEGVENISAGAYVDGTLEDLGGGNYRFTFNDPLEEISGVAFEPGLTHRVGIEIRDAEIFGGEPEAFNSTFDIQPSTGDTSGITMREIVAQENCTSCHGNEEFAFHGGPRRDVDYCVTCHQPDAFDGGGIGATLDFRVMIHKIHAGVNLTENYEFCGFGCERFGSPPDNFNHVVFPQSTQNCVTCHDPENPATPQASNIDGKATAQVCASCHDDLAFDETGLTNANRNHIGLAQPNETCEACHSPTGLLQGNLAYHVIESQVEAQKIAYNILDISNTGEGMSPIVTFEVVNRTRSNRPANL
jgi:OmcA/MtrC family decaheme c-type cytochrome